MDAKKHLVYNWIYRQVTGGEIDDGGTTGENSRIPLQNKY